MGGDRRSVAQLGVLLVVLSVGCSEEAAAPSPGTEAGPVSPPALPAPGQAGQGVVTSPAPQPVMPAPSVTSPPAQTVFGDPVEAEPMAGMGGATVGMPPVNMMPPMNMLPPMVPSPPMVPAGGETANAPDVECGFSPGGAQDDVLIGGRKVIVDYPCDRPVGTKAIFILNLHGTMQLENVKIYQRFYFSVHKHTETHDFIIAAPRAIGSQWENGPGKGMDEPHIMDVIDFVYEKLNKFDIQSMWVAGHSWGAMYTSTFACKPELQDKVKGVVLMSGLPQAPACADRISIISSIAENDIVSQEVNQSVAPRHGCGAMTTQMVGNNRQTLWPDCDPGFVHANYYMFGKKHEDALDPEVVEVIADQIKSTIE